MSGLFAFFDLYEAEAQESLVSATIIFVAVLLMITIAEATLEHFEVWSKKAKLEGLFKKLYREFMLMGLISFSLFILKETIDLDSNQYYHAFELAHIVVSDLSFLRFYGCTANVYFCVVGRLHRPFFRDSSGILCVLHHCANEET
jgi:hypothetical protein